MNHSLSKHSALPKSKKDHNRVGTPGNRPSEPRNRSHTGPISSASIARGRATTFANAANDSKQESHATILPVDHSFRRKDRRTNRQPAACSVKGNTTPFERATDDWQCKPPATTSTEHLSTSKEKRLLWKKPTTNSWDLRKVRVPKKGRIFPTGPENIPASGPSKVLQFCSTSLCRVNRINKHFLEHCCQFFYEGIQSIRP